MIQNSHDDIINDIGKRSYVHTKNHNISNKPNKKELSNENKKNQINIKYCY